MKACGCRRGRCPGTGRSAWTGPWRTCRRSWRAGRCSLGVGWRSVTHAAAVVLLKGDLLELAGVHVHLQRRVLAKVLAVERDARLAGLLGVAELHEGLPDHSALENENLL